MFPPDFLLLWGCDEIRAMWVRDFDWIDRREVARGSFVDLWKLLDNRLDTRELFAVTAWYL